MANIVELREMSDDKLEEMLENGREEMFNLRFQNASARLDDYSRLKFVRREIAQLESLLNMRRLAKEVAAGVPEVGAVLEGKAWRAMARFSYEESLWQVEFLDEEENQLALAKVNLNQKKRRGRKAKGQPQPNLVNSYEITG
jgi:large subunit ribosomal protein L29